MLLKFWLESGVRYVEVASSVAGNFDVKARGYRHSPSDR